MSTRPDRDRPDLRCPGCGAGVVGASRSPCIDCGTADATRRYVDLGVGRRRCEPCALLPPTPEELAAYRARRPPIVR